MNLRQAAEMALKALENMSPDTDTLVEVEPHVWEYRGSLAIQALRQALSHPEQEPVIDCPRCGHCCPEREWVGLTDKERADWHAMGLVGVELVAAHLEEKNT